MKKQLLKALAPFMVASMLANPLVACSTPTDPSTELPNPDPNPDVPRTPTIEFKDVSDSFTKDFSPFRGQPQVSKAAIQDAVQALYDQSNAIGERAKIWEDSSSGQERSVAQTLRLVEENIAGKFSYGVAGNSVTELASYIPNLISTIGQNMFSNPTDGQTFIKQANLFREASIIGQRQPEYFKDKANAETNLLNQLQSEFGITAATATAAAAELQKRLNASIPAAYGKDREKLITQWGNLAQFEGWMSDLKSVGITTSIPNEPTFKTSSNSRAAIQTENGLSL